MQNYFILNAEKMTCHLVNGVLGVNELFNSCVYQILRPEDVPTLTWTHTGLWYKMPFRRVTYLWQQITLTQTFCNPPIKTAHRWGNPTCL